MNSEAAIEALSALAHSGRLAVFRLLVRAGTEGLAAGEVARLQETPANTMSTQLAILNRSGLIRARREQRSIIYSADYGMFATLMGFLVEDCCDGHPEICGQLATIMDAAPACAAKSVNAGEIPS